MQVNVRTIQTTVFVIAELKHHFCSPDWTLGHRQSAQSADMQRRLPCWTVRGKDLYFTRVLSFLSPELINEERPEGRPLFAYHMWGPWRCSIEIDRNSPTLPPFLTWGKKSQILTQISIPLLFGAPKCRTEDFRKWWAYFMVPTACSSSLFRVNTELRKTSFG